MSKKILVVEDEESISDLIVLNLKLDGYDPMVCANGNKAFKLFKERKFDLILLDVMLPEVDGYSLCEMIRLENRYIPIIMLTAKGSDQDKIKGLKLGADDYLSKPFNLEELLLRISNLLKRSNISDIESNVNSIEFGDCSINFYTYKVKGVDGEEQLLSKRQIKLLKLLIDKNGEVVSREEILEKVWGFDVYVTTRTIDNYIVEIRRLFELDPRNCQHFHSVRGVGYRFTL